MQEALKALAKYEVTLNNEKCIYGVSKLIFLGHELSAMGIRPTSNKVAAIKRFSAPETSEEVRSFLGLVNYVGKFIPDLATISDPLRQLTKKDTKFVWGPEQRRSFELLKMQIALESTLGCYDVNDRTQLIADDIQVGLGAVLIQTNGSGSRIISYASKSFSAVERRYCQTEKETLGMGS